MPEVFLLDGNIWKCINISYIQLYTAQVTSIQDIL